MVIESDDDGCLHESPLPCCAGSWMNTRLPIGFEELSAAKPNLSLVRALVDTDHVTLHLPVS
jgi:hypothetical protein